MPLPLAYSANAGLKARRLSLVLLEARLTIRPSRLEAAQNGCRVQSLSLIHI